jgi:hypothetical protein
MYDNQFKFEATGSCIDTELLNHKRLAGYRSIIPIKENTIQKYDVNIEQYYQNAA